MFTPHHKFVIRHDRLAEWGVSLVHFLFGITLLLDGDTLTSSSAYTLLSQYHIYINDLIVGTIFSLLGLFRLAALYINGTRTFTPAWRVGGSIASATLNTLMGLAFLIPTLQLIKYYILMVFGFEPIHPQVVANTAATTYLVLAWLDYYSAGRAGFDNGIIKRHR